MSNVTIYPDNEAKSRASIIAIPTIFLVSTILLLSNISFSAESTDNNIVTQAIKAACWSSSIVVLLFVLKPGIRLNRWYAKVGLAQLAIISLSTIPHFSFFYTFQALIQCFALTIGASYSVSALGRARSIDILLYTLSFIVVISLATCVFVPSIGVHTSYDLLGEWKGILSHKNGLGFISLTLIAILVSTKNSFGRLSKYTMIAISLTTLVKSGSSTSLSCIVLYMFAFIFSKLFSRSNHRKALLVVILIITLLSFSYYNEISNYVIVDLLGKDASFTGRTDIWQYGLALGVENPIIGQGAMLLARDPDLLTDLATMTFSGIRSFHSAYVTTFVEFGAVGVLLYLTPYFAALRLWLKSGQNRRFDSLAAFALTLLLYNAFENANLIYSGIGTLVLGILFLTAPNKTSNE